MCLEGCNREASTTIPNLSSYGSQVQGVPWFDKDSKGKNNQEVPPGSLSIWTPAYEGMNPLVQNKIDQTLKDLIQRFEGRYSSVNVIWSKYSDSKIYKKYSAKVKDGLGPDLLLVHNFMIPALSKRNEIKAIHPKSVRLKELRPRLLQPSKVNGKMYGIPFIVNVQLLCFNKQVVKSAPRTFDDLIEASRSGISTAIGGNFLQTMCGLPGFNARLFGAKPSSRQALKKGLSGWITMLRTSDEEPNMALFKNPSLMKQYFSEGKISIINCQSIDLPYLRKSLGKENLGIVEMPTVNGKEPQSRLTGASFTINPYTSSNQNKLALRFSNYAISIDQQQQIAINWNSLLPVNQNSDFNKDLLPVLSTSEKSFINSSELTDEKLEIISLNFNSIQDVYQDATAGLIDPVQASNEIVDLLEIQQ